MSCGELTIAPRARRLGAWLVDMILVFLFWYFFTGSDLAAVNALMQTLDPVQVGALDQLAAAVFRMLSAFLLKLVFCQTVYFCLIPALIGRGRTAGKLLLGLCVAGRDTGREISPSRLVLREFVGRSLLETLLVLPGVVSAGMVLFSREQRSLRDRLAGTVVVKDTGDGED